MNDLNYAVPPGAYLEEWMEHYDVSDQKIAARTQRSVEEIRRVINGLTPVTPDLAEALQRVTGIKAEAFLLYEDFYSRELARLGLRRGESAPSEMD